MEKLNELFTGKDTTIARDMKLNFQKILDGGPLDAREAWPALLALAVASGCMALEDVATEEMQKLDFTKAQVQEAREAAAQMGVLNTYYKFRGMMGASEDFKAAGLRMNVLSKPELGKPLFEAIAFSVSVLNGCPTCVVSHDSALRGHGFSVEKIHDLARLAAVVKGASSLLI